MKKLLLFATVLTIQANLYGQTVPNGTFENWNSTPFDEPTGWRSGNQESVPKMGITPITKVTGYTGFGVRLQTIIVGSDTAQAFISMGDPKGQGGVPYSEKPTAISGFYRYNLPGIDTALLLITFKKNGSVINTDLFKIKGTGNQSTFTSFSFPLTLSVTPDTVIFAAAASNLLSGIGIQNGSFLELDKLIFTGSGITQQIPNNEFENWTAMSYDQPLNWEIWGQGVSKTTDKYTGNYAVRLETTSDGGYVSFSGITTGQVTPNNGPAGGIPYTNTNDTLCGYYKYTSVGNAKATIYVGLSKNGTPVGGNNKLLTAASGYTYFEVPFQSGTIPDTMRIDVQSSEWPVSPANVGSVLYLDNLYFKSNMSVGILEKQALDLKNFVYPNPVSNILSIHFEKNISNSVTLFIYDATAKKVNTNSLTINPYSLEMNVENLPTGIYFYEIKMNDETVRNKFVKE